MHTNKNFKKPFKGSNIVNILYNKSKKQYMKFVIVLLFALLFLLLGCVSQIPETDTNQVTDEIQQNEQEIPLENSPDNEPVQNENEKPNTEIETQKLGDEFVCNDPLIFEKIDELFEGELFIGRLAGLGGARGIFTCNILIDNQPIVQIELRQQFDIGEAVYLFNDQERQYFLQFSDFEKNQHNNYQNSKYHNFLHKIKNNTVKLL